MSILKDISAIATKVSNTVKYYSDEGIDLTYIPDLEQKLRMAICKACPDDKFMKWTRQCSECGCFMDFKTKLKYDPVISGQNNEKTLTGCPLGYW